MFRLLHSGVTTCQAKVNDPLRTADRDEQRAELIINNQTLLHLYVQSWVLARLQQSSLYSGQQIEKSFFGIFVQFVGLVSAAGRRKEIKNM